jgi:DNA-binding transcriptional MerR regulator
MKIGQGKYSIKDLERLSGVKAHTIRIWEQRYNLLVPERTDTNIRLYNDKELKQLLNIALLINQGSKISHISKLSESQICEKIHQLSLNPTHQDQFFQIQINELVLAMLEFKDSKFDKVISTCTLKYGFESTMMNVLIPFLHKIGVMWRTGEANIVQEHFISNLIRRKILVAIDGFIDTEKEDAETYLLYLPENELHEIGLLFGKYLLKVRGKNVIYLGQNVPFEDVVYFCRNHQPKYVLTFFTAAYAIDTIKTYLSSLSSEIAQFSTILIAGPQLCHLGDAFPPKVQPLYCIQDLIDLAEGNKKTFNVSQN